MWLDRDMKLVFQERYNLEYRNGIKDPSRHQWSRVGQRRRIFSWQIFAKNECLHCRFNILWVHKGFLIKSVGQALFQLVMAFADGILAVCSPNQRVGAQALGTTCPQAAGDQVP
jgi:hypothetical protein